MEDDMVNNLLAEAHASGLYVSSPDGQRLKIRGPDEAEPLALRLSQEREAVLLSLANPKAHVRRLDEADIARLKAAGLMVPMTPDSPHPRWLTDAADGIMREELGLAVDIPLYIQSGQAFVSEPVRDFWISTTTLFPWPMTLA